MTERRRISEERKARIIVALAEETMYTNQVAKAINVTWPVADRLLTELLDSGDIIGDKIDGYYLPKQKLSIGDRIKKLFNK